MTFNWLWIVNPYTAIILSAILALALSSYRVDSTMDKEEDSLLYSNLVSIGSIFLAILLFMYALYAAKFTPIVCSSIKNVTSNYTCSGIVNNGLSVLGSDSVLLVAAILLFAILFRARYYSNYDKKKPRLKLIVGFLVWFFLIFAVMYALFTILSISLAIVKPSIIVGNTIASNSTSTITTTSSILTTVNASRSLYCNTQPTFVHVGNSLTCSSFTATILNATNTSVSLKATYNGISINKTVTNQKGYIGDTFALNFSGAVVFARVWSYFPSNQTVYFQMSTAPIVLTTTITIPTTTRTTI